MKVQVPNVALCMTAVLLSLVMVNECHAVPGWARHTQATSHPAADCAKSAAAAIASVFGSPGTIDAPSSSAFKARQIRGFDANSAIFVNCYPNLKKFCDNGVSADYSLLVFSDKGKGEAGRVRDAFQRAFKESKAICID